MRSSLPFIYLSTNTSKYRSNLIFMVEMLKHVIVCHYLTWFHQFSPINSLFFSSIIIFSKIPQLFLGHLSSGPNCWLRWKYYPSLFLTNYLYGGCCGPLFLNYEFDVLLAAELVSMDRGSSAIFKIQVCALVMDPGLGHPNSQKILTSQTPCSHGQTLASRTIQKLSL